MKQFRVGLDMTQEQIAAEIGYDRTNYVTVEQGKRDGTIAFWKALQRRFNIPGHTMWALICDEETDM